METRIRGLPEVRTGSPADRLIAEIGQLLAIHLAVALLVCLALDLCGA
jgi:hypothetical protein